MPDNALLFAFPDGVLKFVCSNCHNKLCCHNGGINLSASGRGGELLRQFPSLQLEVQPQAGNMLYAPLLPSGCRFLASGKCSLHDEGYYPDYCRLYPFTLLAIVDGTIVIAPDPRCEYVAVADGSGIRHEDLAAIVAKVEPCVIPVTANRGAGYLSRELLIRDTAGECLKNGDSLASLLAFCHVVDNNQEADLPQLDVAKEMAGFSTRLTENLPGWLSLIGLGSTVEEPVPDLERLLQALLPAQRLFGRWEDASSFAMAYAALAAYLFRLPSTLQQRMTPLDICQYFSSLEPLIWHFVHWNDVPHYTSPLEKRWAGLTDNTSWGDFLQQRQQNIPASTIVELRLIYEDLHEGLSWN